MTQENQITPEQNPKDVIDEKDEKNLSPELQKILSLFKTETYTKVDTKEIGPGSFIEIKNNLDLVALNEELDRAADLVTQHLENHPDSIYGQFLNGTISLIQGRTEAQNYFKRLIEVFRNVGKWSMVEYIARLILEYKENQMALRYLAQALEKLNHPKESMDTWERLARIDRDDADVSQRVAENLLAKDNRTKGLYFLRQAFEANVRRKEMSKLDELWKKIMNINPGDLAYVEKIEKMLEDLRLTEKLARLLHTVLDYYKSINDVPMQIHFMKKILGYSTAPDTIRRDLVQLYKNIYATHSRLEQILKISNIESKKTAPLKAIEVFEAHAALDVGNYIFHRSWGVGKIKSIAEDWIYIDFQDKKDHRMAIEMAIPSLQPLEPEHIWVYKAEKKEELQSYLDNDPILFFEILFNSFNKRMTLSDIKSELIPDFVSLKDWAKWWTKMRGILKKDPKFGISDKKKDEFFLREKPISFSENILNLFNRNDSLDERITIALDFLQNANEEDLLSATYPHLIDFFSDIARDTNPSSRLVSALYLLNNLLARDPDRNDEAASYLQRLEKIAMESHQPATIARGINNLDIKRTFLQIIKDKREQWPEIFTEMLFELPIKIHKFVINELLKEEKYASINTFIDQIFVGYRKNPEIFLWTVKNLTQGPWSGNWLNYNYQDMLLYLMRLMLEAPRIEQKGTRLKNSCIETLNYNDYQILREALQQEPIPFLTKIMDLARGLSILDEETRQSLYKMAADIRPELSSYMKHESQEEEITDLKEEEDLFYVTQAGFNIKSAMYHDLVTNQLPDIAREIGRAADYGDLRENAEYKAALEKQGTLKATMDKLKIDMERARVLESKDIDISKVGFGVKIIAFNQQTEEKEEITILGPWDANHTKNIISYKAPLGRAFLNKTIGDTVVFRIGDSERSYVIQKLERAY